MNIIHAVHKTDKIKTLSQENLPDVMRCLSQLDAPYDKPQFFIPPTAEYLKTIFSGYGKSAGIYHGNNLVAFASIVFPKTGQNNLGHLIGLSNSELRKVIQLEHSFVTSDYRGRGISNYLWDYLVQPVDKEYDYMLSTVAPLNNSSLSTAFKRKQRIIRLSDIYHQPRFLLYRTLHKDSEPLGGSICVPCDDLDEIKNLLKSSYQGWTFANNLKSLLFTRWNTYA